MKKLLSVLFLGSLLSVAACGKDKKPATDPAKPEPAATDPAKADPAAPAPAAGEAKPEEKKAGGW